MANTLVNGTQLASAMIGGLVDAGVLTSTIWKDPEFNGVAGKGDTVNVRRLGVQAAANFTGTAAKTDLAEATVAVQLSHQPYVQSTVSTKEATLRVEDFYAQVIAPGVGGVAEYLEAQVAALLATTTTPEVTGASARAALIGAREVLTEAKVPLSGRYFAASPAMVSAILSEDWVTADKISDGGTALREAVVGRAFGFTIVESTHIADVDFDTGGVDPTGYAYHMTSAIMASRIPNPPRGGAESATAAAYGMGARVVYSYDSSALADLVTVDTLAGFKLTDDAGSRIVVPVYV